MIKMVIEWYDAKEVLPETSCEVLVNSVGDYIQSVNYSAKHKKFNCYDCDEAEHVGDKEIKPKRWAYSPKFPDHSDTVNEIIGEVF